MCLRASLILLLGCVSMWPFHGAWPDKRFDGVKQIVNEPYSKRNEKRHHSIRSAADGSIEVFRVSTDLRVKSSVGLEYGRFWNGDRYAISAKDYNKIDTTRFDGFSDVRYFQQAHRMTAGLPNDEWLLVCHRPYWHVEMMYILRLDKDNNIINVDSILSYISFYYTPQVCGNGQGNKYLIGSTGFRIFIEKIFPTLDTAKYEVKCNFPRDLMREDLTCIGLTDTTMLLCIRHKPYDFNILDSYGKNELGYLICDYHGNVIQPLRKLDYQKLSYAKTHSAFLPGQIGIDTVGLKGIFAGVDLCRFRDGSIVLSVTDDETNNWSVYHVKFTSAGEVLEPRQRKVNDPRSFAGKPFPEIMKTGLAELFVQAKRPQRDSTIFKQVFWGFNQTGEFYWDTIGIKEER